MDARQCATVQSLISDFDNTRAVYTRLEPLLIRPHLRFLVSRMTQAHVAIADDLVWQMDLTGGLTARRGTSTLARLRANVESWIAIADLDVEVGCLKCIARHETRVVQRFRATLDDVKDLHQNLHRELRELERAVFRIESLAREMETPPLAVPRRPATVSTVPTVANHKRYRS